MKHEQLLCAVGGVSDDLVMDAAPGNRKRRSRWTGWVAAAACVCFAAVGAWTVLPRTAPDPIASSAPDHSPGPVDILPTQPQVRKEVSTSDTYVGLEELLTFLSGHDDHNARSQDKGGAGSDAVRSASGYTAVTWNGYAYHIVREAGMGNVRISHLGADPERAGTLDVDDAELLFQWGGCLAVVGRWTEELTLDSPGRVWMKLYDLSDPAEPTLLVEFSQLGGLAGCWQDGGDLYLLTGDGMCACGYSRLSDPADYYPQLERDGQRVPWEEAEVAILGEPLRVEYTAAVRVSLETGEVVAKRAFYGQVDGVFHGEGWLALVTEGHGKDTESLPMVYAFSRNFTCEGKLDTAALLGISGTAALRDGVRPDGQYPKAVSVSRAGDVLRVLGSVTEFRDGSHTASLLAAALDLSTGESGVSLLPVERFYHIGDLLWEGDRAILFVSVLNTSEREDRLCLARFDGAQVEWTDTGLTCDSVDGVDMMYSYGSPQGWLETIIPLGEGKYLRYNGTPDGLDLYDCSGEMPVLVHRSPGGLVEGRFEFEWEVYDETAVGILVVWPDEDGAYRNVTFTWDIYRVKTDGLELLARYPVSGGELTALEYGGQRWLAQWDGTLLAVDTR